MEKEAQPEEILQKEKQKGNAAPAFPEELSLEALCGEGTGVPAAVPQAGTSQTGLRTDVAPGARLRRRKVLEDSGCT